MNRSAAPTDPARGGKCPDVGAAGRSHRPDAPRPTLADVYASHADFVFRSARHLGVDEPDLGDVVHDVFLVVLRRLPEFDHERSMRSWLYGITRRVVMHRGRARARAVRRLSLVATTAAPSDPTSQAEMNEAATLVESFLAELDPGKRRVFALAEIEGLTAVEIAAAEEIPVNTVYSRLRAARARLLAWIARIAPTGGER